MAEEVLTRESLRELFLFSGLSELQLDWILRHAKVEHYPHRAKVISEGDPAACFYVLLSGALRMTKQDSGGEVEVKRSDQRGAYCGATQFFHGEDQQRYITSVYALSDLTFLTLPARELAHQFRRWFPMAAHLLDGSYVSWQNADAVVSRRRRLLALGQMSAGLMHELNNPATAAMRATAALRDRVASMRRKLALLVQEGIDPELLGRLLDIQEQAAEQITEAPPLTPMQQADRENEIADWLAWQGMEQDWDLAAIFAGTSLTTQSLEAVQDLVSDGRIENALRWLAYALDTEMLIHEIEDGTTRISELVGAVKQYSQLDRAPHQWIDVHDGLDSTLVMLRSKIGPGITVVKNYENTLPHIPAYPGELNQVWTNLIDNAIGAMGASGTLTIHTALAEDQVCVEIGDTGPGIPVEVQQRIFEPFFTTKAVGEGTGLGLDISWRVVVERHHGDLRVETKPGDTRFQVLLPLAEHGPV